MSSSQAPPLTYFQTYQRWIYMQWTIYPDDRACILQLQLNAIAVNVVTAASVIVLILLDFSCRYICVGRYKGGRNRSRCLSPFNNAYSLITDHTGHDLRLYTTLHYFDNSRVNIKKKILTFLRMLSRTLKSLWFVILALVLIDYVVRTVHCWVDTVSILRHIQELALFCEQQVHRSCIKITTQSQLNQIRQYT